MIWWVAHGILSYISLKPRYIQGGTNLRVCSVTLKGNGEFSLVQEKYKVSDALKTGEATDLFDYIADSVAHFLQTRTELKSKSDGSKEQLYLGFTFSFPVKQTALDKGTLSHWTKGFETRNAKGKDVVKLLQDALDRKQVPVKCSALVNDTVGTMLSRAYQSGGALMGAIFVSMSIILIWYRNSLIFLQGTGTNAAYLERSEKIKTLSTSGHAGTSRGMIVNTVCSFSVPISIPLNSPVITGMGSIRQ